MTSKLTFYVMGVADADAATNYYDFNYDLAIDWAYEMLLQGYDTPHLVMLAGFQKPTSYFEAKDYIEKALKELKIPILRGRDSILALCIYHVMLVAEGHNVQEHLNDFYSFYYDSDFRYDVSQFVFISWDWNELEYGCPQRHLQEVLSLDNIQQFAIDTANNWLDNLEHQFSLPS